MVVPKGESDGEPVTYRTNDPYDFDANIDHEPEQRAKHRRGRSFGVLVALAMTGIVAALVWRAYGGSGPVLPSFTSAASVSSSSPEDMPVGLKDFQAFQQQLASQMQAATQLLTAQQAQIKGLSEQVAALPEKLDNFQRAAPAAPATPVPAVPKPTVTPAKKKPAAAKSVDASTAAAPPPLQLSR
jgi:uncharacterized coiled-coil protein SlyX